MQTCARILGSRWVINARTRSSAAGPICCSARVASSQLKKFSSNVQSGSASFGFFILPAARIALRSTHGRAASLSAMILTALIVIAALAIVSWFVVRAIWQQLGGEPAYAREIAQAVAKGDLAADIRIEAGDSSSLLVALKEMRDRLNMPRAK